MFNYLTFRGDRSGSECLKVAAYPIKYTDPVRADMVDEPSEYSWSSYGCNALGVETELQTPHELYIALGKTKDKRLENYRQLFKAHVGVELLKEIRASVNKGLALGNERFANQIEALTEKRVTTRKPGRPKMELVDEDKN